MAMRLSVKLLIFMIILNGWAGLMQETGMDDHLGFNAETGDTSELEDAAEQDLSISSGGIVESLVGVVSSTWNQFQTVLNGISPAAQMLSNIVPPGLPQDLVSLGFSVVGIVIFIDLANFARGVG